MPRRREKRVALARWSKKYVVQRCTERVNGAVGGLKDALWAKKYW